MASSRLDAVYACDIEQGWPELGKGEFDCVILGDVLEHLRDPERVLYQVRELLAPDGLLLICGPNVGHFSVVKALLRADFMYQPEGLLDATHLRFFTFATYTKLLMDSGFLPRIENVIGSGGTEHALPAATPFLEYLKVHPERALRQLDAYQYVFSARKLPDAPAEFGSVPLSFVVLVNDEDQLNSNLLRSPCLGPGTPHQVIPMVGQPNAATGFREALSLAENDLVVCAQQDIYFPRGWDSWFVEGVEAAEARHSPLGLMGAFGLKVVDQRPVQLGRVVDRDTLLNPDVQLPAVADSLDEIVLAFRKSQAPEFDSRLGFHLYGLDACLSAAEEGRTNVVIDAPCFHNSLFAHLPMAFHHSRALILEKWPQRPLFSNMGRLDEMVDGYEQSVQVTVRQDTDTMTFSLYSPEAFPVLGDLWTRSAWEAEIFKAVSWLGVPVWQVPEDLILFQELIVRERPDLIIETGFGEGGSSYFFASMLELLGNGRVLSIDNALPPDARERLSRHRVGERITLIEGDSVAGDTVREVMEFARNAHHPLVILDSDHSRAHVLAELECYAPLVGPGGYIVVMDGIMERLADAPKGDRNWRQDNPAMAVREFLSGHSEFELDGRFNRLGVSYCIDGFIRRRGVSDRASRCQDMDSYASSSGAEIERLRTELAAMKNSNTWRAGRWAAAVGAPALRLGRDLGRYARTLKGRLGYPPDRG